MSVDAVNHQNGSAGSGSDLLTTMALMAQRQSSQALAQRAADAALVASQAATLAAIQAVGAGRLDVYA